MAPTDVSTLPKYVEYGGQAGGPGPFRCKGGRLLGLLLEGDAKRIAKLTDQMFNGPAGKKDAYRSIGPYVLLMVGEYKHITSATRPFNRWGFVRETQASFWIPILGGNDEGPVYVADRLYLAVPYILVDNPMSIVGGREDYGYPKTMGRFDPEDGLGPATCIHAYGGQFRPDDQASWDPLLEITPVSVLNGLLDTVFDGSADLVRHLSGGLLDRDGDDDVTVPGLKLIKELVSKTLRGEASQLFLKQFRDASDGTRACYQELVEAPLKVSNVKGRPSLRKHYVRIHHLDSHPITRTLGVKSQTSALSFGLELDMVIERGSPVPLGEAAAPGPFPLFEATVDVDAIGPGG
jgi:hypothetical protein